LLSPPEAPEGQGISWACYRRAAAGGLAPTQTRTQLKWAREEDPDRWDLLACLGNVEFLTGDYIEAILFYERALAMAPGSAKVRKNLTMTHERAGDCASARAQWETLRRHPVIGPTARQRLLILDC